MVAPYLLPNLPFIKSESVTTFSIPSAAQNLECAKGRSFETFKTTVFSRLAADSLNFLTELAHTPVSMLGKMLIRTFLPLKSFNFIVERSVLTNLNFGAFLPTFGSFPMVFIGLPFYVIFAISVWIKDSY